MASAAIRLLKTVCSRSDLACECRRAPIPDVGQFLGRLSAVPPNLTVGGGGARRRASGSATMFGQRLLRLMANWDFRPLPVIRAPM